MAVHHIVFCLTPSERMKYKPVFCNSDEAKDEAEAIARARQVWNLPDDKKVDTHVEVFKE